MIVLLEESWTVQVDTLGFSAPLDDQGDCGADGNFDIFISLLTLGYTLG